MEKKSTESGLNYSPNKNSDRFGRKWIEVGKRMRILFEYLITVLVNMVSLHWFPSDTLIQPRPTINSEGPYFVRASAKLFSNSSVTNVLNDSLSPSTKISTVLASCTSPWIRASESSSSTYFCSARFSGLAP